MTERFARGLDPRYFQIASLAVLLAWGMASLGFDLRPTRAALLVGTCLGAQALFGGLIGLRFEAKSALISGLSLCLLLRTSSDVLAVAAAFLAIASKFVLRARNRHVFNPTAFGIAVALAASPDVWVSPGQWGSLAVLAFLIACAGSLTVSRAARADVSLAFLLAWAGLLFARALWLGDPLQIPLRQLQSGALLLFAFFMISDPKTTPESRAGRVLFAALVAAGAFHIQFNLYRTNGLIWSLIACAPCVPLVDRLLPGRRYEWRAPARPTAGAEPPPLAALEAT